MISFLKKPQELNPLVISNPMTKFYVFLFLATISSTSAFSQKTMTKKGAERYNNYDYISAVDHLESVSTRTTDAQRQLAASYNQLGDYAKAEECFGVIAQRNDRIPIDILNYAKALMKNGKYEEAQLQMDIYKELNPCDEDTELFRELPAKVEEYNANFDNFSVKNLEVNSEEEDFAPVVTNGILYFASSRGKRAAVNRKWIGNELSFLDVYTAKIDNKQMVDLEAVPNKDINKKYHEGPVAFAKNGSEMFITRNNYGGVSKEGIINLKLLISAKNGEGWDVPVELPFNSSEYSVGHATASPDGSFIVFASDMPGGEGGSDLYLSRRESGAWSLPKPLCLLNTPGNEVFPYFHESGILMFSSDGHPGLGGLDMFVAQWNDGEIGRMMNAGAPLNSSSDDFTPWINSDLTAGYFASNRKNGKGDDDIYSFTMEVPFLFGRLFQGIALDRDGKPMDNASVFIRNEQGEIVKEGTTDENGFYSLTSDAVGDLDIIFKKKGYFDLKLPVLVLDDSPDIIERNVAMEVDPGYSLLYSIRDRRTKVVLENVRITAVDNFSGAQEIIYTDEDGLSLRPILNKKVGDKISYSIRLEKEGYITKGSTYNRVIDREGTYDLSEEMNINMEKIAVGVDIAQATEIQPIFFDFNKFDIRPDAALELDKIVRIMNENPTMVVELGSHTDCRGSAKFNQILSQKRAEASAQYIRLRISNPDRIYGKGFGEYKILNGCICEGGRVPTYSDEEHAINRRTEFVIVNF